MFFGKRTKWRSDSQPVIEKGLRLALQRALCGLFCCFALSSGGERWDFTAAQAAAHAAAFQPPGRIERAPGSPGPLSSRLGETADEKRDEERHATRKRYPITKEGGIEYTRGSDYSMTLDVYRPRESGPFPGVLMLHGGAWASGSKLHWRRHAVCMARQGFVVVCVNYRLAPRFPFPAQIQDARQAIRWMRRHAETYQIDPDRIGAFGYSAGGHLALLLATAPNPQAWDEEVEEEWKRYPATIRFAMAGGAPSDFQWLSPRSRSLEYWMGATPAEEPERYRAASPLWNLDEQDDCCFFLYHAEYDQLVEPETMERFATKARGLSKVVQTQTLPGVEHFLGFLQTDIIDDAVDFYRRQFPHDGQE